MSAPGSEWSYEEEENWEKMYPSCGGFQQSPINIHPNSLFDENRLSLNLMNSYNMVLGEADLENNGHTGKMGNH